MGRKTEKKERGSREKPEWVSKSFTIEDNRGQGFIEEFADFWKERLGNGHPVLTEWLGIVSTLLAIGAVVVIVNVWIALEDMNKEAVRAKEEAAINAWLAEGCRVANYVDNSPATMRALFDDAARKNPALLEKKAPDPGAFCRKGKIACSYEGDGWKCAKISEKNPYVGNFRMMEPVTSSESADWLSPEPDRLP